MVWKPPKEVVENSNVYNVVRELGLRDYDEFVKKSIEDYEWFWGWLPSKLNIKWFKDFERVMDTSQGVEWTKWYIGGRINASYNVLDKHMDTPTERRTAFIWSGEDGSVVEYSYRRLFDEVNRLASAFKKEGLEPGETVSLYMPMIPETIVTLLAVVRMGGIPSPIFSGFGVDAVKTRIVDAQSRFIVVSDIGVRRGRHVNLLKNVEEATEGLDFVDKIIVVNRTGTYLDEEYVDYRDFISQGDSYIKPTEMDPNDPALLLYTSGTTGKPKGVLISHIGVLIQPSKEIYFNLDLKDKDLFMWYTDIGWMMGPWQIFGVGNLGGTHMIVEGAPDYPSPSRIWELVERYRITIFGGAATLYRLFKHYGRKYIDPYDISSIRILGNTGEPIDRDTWMWVMEVIGRWKAPMINLSGGTEIFGCLVLPSPTVPLKPSTLYGPGLGMDVDVFNDDGKPVRGEVGYLVCKKPTPSMTRGFWRDPERYINTYWSRWKGVWYHGDWALIDEDGHLFILGRADDVIKVAGKRVGPAEIESVINSHEKAVESACIGVPDPMKGEKIVCFVKVREYTRGLENQLAEYVSKNLGKPFKPSEIYVVKDLPRTRSGKIMRRVIKALYMGKPAGDLSTLENPESLDEIIRVIR